LAVAEPRGPAFDGELRFVEFRPSQLPSPSNFLAVDLRAIRGLQDFWCGGAAQD